MRKLQAMFLTGLLTLLPIWLVWVVFKFVFGLLSDISRPLIGPLAAGIAAADPRLLGWLAEPWVQTAIALVATIAFIVLVGALVRRVVGQRLLAWSEKHDRAHPAGQDRSTAARASCWTCCRPSPTAPSAWC